MAHRTILPYMVLVVTLSIGLNATNISFIGYVNGDSESDAQMITEYCMEHAQDIIAGLNPVNDLVKAGLVSQDYLNKSCHDVKVQAEIDKSWSDLMDELIVTPK